MQPLKAIHIVKSLQPTQTPKLTKEYVFTYADKGGRRISTCGNSRSYVKQQKLSTTFKIEHYVVFF